MKLQSSIHPRLLQKLKNNEILCENFTGAPALRVTRAETRLTVYRSLPYGCRVQLVGGPKNVELFVTLSAFLFKVVNSFFTVLVIRIFPMKFSEQANQGAIRLFKCSSKVSSAVPGKFA